MAKSKRSKHMRAMRKILRDKLAKKDEVKRLASLKKDALIRKTKSSHRFIQTNIFFIFSTNEIRR